MRPTSSATPPTRAERAASQGRPLHLPSSRGLDVTVVHDYTSPHYRVDGLSLGLEPIEGAELLLAEELRWVYPPLTPLVHYREVRVRADRDAPLLRIQAPGLCGPF